MLKMVTDDTDRYDLAGSLDELVAAGALRMLMAGLEIEVADYIERHQELVDEAGRRVVGAQRESCGADLGDRCRCIEGARPSRA